METKVEVNQQRRISRSSKCLQCNQRVSFWCVTKMAAFIQELTPTNPTLMAMFRSVSGANRGYSTISNPRDQHKTRR